MSKIVDQVIKNVKSAEITKHQDQILQNNSNAVEISERHDRKVPENKRLSPKPKQIGGSSKKKQKSCYRCGAQPGHPSGQVLSVSQPKMPSATHATKRVIIPRSANLPNETIEFVKIRRKMIYLYWKKIWEDIYVFKGLKEPLLGQLAIEKLNLVARINEIQSQSYEERIKAKYPQLFHGLGELEGEYEIKLKPDAQPFAIMTPRSTPLPMKSKAKEELARMEKLGVIRNVYNLTNWYVGMVTVPKPNGKIRMCVDLKKLNENVFAGKRI